MAEQLSDLSLYATIAAQTGVSSGDAKLPLLLSAASDCIKRFLNRKQLHYASAYSEKVASSGRLRLALELTPLGAVASVTLEDGSVIDAAEYSVEDTGAGFLYRAYGWPHTGVIRSGLLYSEYLAGSEKKNITVVYAGGWVTPAQAASVGWTGPTRSLPYDVELGCIETVRALLQGNAQGFGVQSESIGAASVSYFAPSSDDENGFVPAGVATMLRKYRRSYLG